MQLSLLLSALVSLVILGAASPMPGGISEDSYKREELENPFSGYGNPFSEYEKKREELENPFSGYGNPFSEYEKKREELENPFSGYGNPFSEYEKRKDLESGHIYSDLTDTY
ncbi:hypothetical protein BDR07DRAFT_1457014 [Suillus spraguei]|nr:hypothetical protein BDR07DRAFT_1457014 [Suillus spraguei]